MKNITLALLSVILITSFISCSSVKVLDSWKSDNVANLKNNNFLVIARTDDQQARIAFENEIVKQMTEDGYNAVASFSKFGDMKPNEKVSEDDKKKFQTLLKSENIDGIVLSVIKDFREETRVIKDGGYYAGGNFSSYYPGYYGLFNTYFYNPMSYSSLGVYVPETTTTVSSKIYILETTVYDLKASGKNQLVAVITSQIENPEKASETAKQYVKKIANSLK
jgi:hypothetical protein